MIKGIIFKITTDQIETIVTDPSNLFLASRNYLVFADGWLLIADGFLNRFQDFPQLFSALDMRYNTVCHAVFNFPQDGQFS
jgi:hypothetical protein